MARFSARLAVPSRGGWVRPVPLDDSTANFSTLGDDFAYVFHAALEPRANGWASAFEMNSQGRVD